MHRYNRIRDFHAARATGVGSSDIPILAGLSKHWGSTTLTLWEAKTGRTPPWNGNERTRVGHDLEAYVLARWVESVYGEEIADRFYMAKLRDRSLGPFKALTECRHPERPYVLAHADLLFDNTDRMARPGDEPYIVEAKTVGLMAGKRREGAIFTGYDLEDKTAQGVPDSVFLQVQWQLFAYGVRVGYVAALIDNQFHAFGPIEADPRVQEKCLALAERFWRHVESNTPPAPETWDDVQRLFPNMTPTTAMIGGEEEARVRAMKVRDKELADRIKELDAERDDIKNAIGILLGGNEVLAASDGSPLAKASEQSRESVVLLAKAKEIAKAQAKKSPPPLTPEDNRILALAEEVRTLGLVSTSSFRTVRY